LVAHLRRALASSGADPSRLLFEVPENAFSDNPDAAVAILQRLADCNVRVAIDDFGSSLAPLNYLMQLPISLVKLAPRLIASTASSGRQLAVLETMIRLGNTLGLQVVAQGIESSDQVTLLARMGCALGQGPLLSSPLDPAQAFQLAEKGSWAITARA
jgi:EAL domain-containing protein (putative c-di-GMP-specific phosphodiesterase class I)